MHISVLLNESIENLSIKEDGISQAIIDASAKIANDKVEENEKNI